MKEDKFYSVLPAKTDENITDESGGEEMDQQERDELNRQDMILLAMANMMIALRTRFDLNDIKVNSISGDKQLNALKSAVALFKIPCESEEE